MGGATLISFDVETSESTDTTPAVWSAELRSNVEDSRAITGREPLYRDTTLYMVPPLLATHLIGFSIARVLITPCKSQVWLSLARLVLARRDLPLDALHEPGFWQVCSWTRFVNALGLEFLFLFLQGETWGFMTLLAQSFCESDEEWAERQKFEGADKES